MATRKEARAKVVAPSVKKKRPTKASAPRKKVARATPSRRAPETLRLKSFTPSLTVSDLRKSLAFYTETLGFFVGESWTEGDLLRGVMLKAGACELGLTQDDWKQGTDRKKGLGFRIWCNTAQDIDAVAARLTAAGFKLAEAPEDHSAWGVRSFAVDDPDGFHLTIARDL
jgi:catechol 2,3-dioxygenase-like lactoylglutathione lyase family enzyme